MKIRILAKSADLETALSKTAHVPRTHGLWKSRVESDCQFSTTRYQISCEKADSRRSPYLTQWVSQVRPMRTELQRELKEKHKFQHKYNKNVVQEETSGEITSHGSNPVDQKRNSLLDTHCQSAGELSMWTMGENTLDSHSQYTSQVKQQGRC